jgi:cysteinyl-tRNA synthetase
MIAGARVEVAPYKKDPMDFVLWKPSKPGEPSWPSPWGAGRPGWHLECSAMAGALLGETFDIHGGGIDLVFPHHENEIAQSRCAHGTPLMAKYWLHNGFLQVEGEKMSKSLGNFVTVRELLQTEQFGGRRWPGEVLRLAMLKTHYRQPIDFSRRSLEEAASNIQSWYSVTGRPKPMLEVVPDEGVIAALCDDLNGWETFLRLEHLATEARRAGASDRFLQSAQFLGFLLPENYFAGERVFVSGTELIVEGLIADRAEARARKDFAEADRIRAELDAMGIALKDSKDPKTGELVTTWEVKR